MEKNLEDFGLENPIKKYTTKDSGKKEVFSSGYNRDSQEDKIRYDLIPLDSLKRIAELYTRGAKLYGDDNWKKGCPYSRVYASLLRHIFAYREGDKTEDHLAAVCWNSMALMYYETEIKKGNLSKEFDDFWSKNE